MKILFIKLKGCHKCHALLEKLRLSIYDVKNLKIINIDEPNGRSEACFYNIKSVPSMALEDGTIITGINRILLEV